MKRFTWPYLATVLKIAITKEGSNSPMRLSNATGHVLNCYPIEDPGKTRIDINVSIEPVESTNSIVLRQGCGEKIVNQIFKFFFGGLYFLRWRKYLIMRLVDSMGRPYWVKFERPRRRNRRYF